MLRQTVSVFQTSYFKTSRFDYNIIHCNYLNCQKTLPTAGKSQHSFSVTSRPVTNGLQGLGQDLWSSS